MDSQRSFLIIGLLLVSFLLWQQWQLDYGPQPVVPEQADAQPVSPSSSSDQDVPVATGDIPTNTVSAPIVANYVQVNTDTFNLNIDLKGGDIVNAELKKYPLELNSEDKYTILTNEPAQLHIAQSGLVGQDGPDASKAGRPIYQAQSENYTLQGDTLRVPLTYTSDTGLIITKTFVFTKQSHTIDVEYSVENTSDAVKQLQPYAQLKQLAREDDAGMFMYTYRGGAYATEEDNYKKYKFSKFEDDPLAEQTKGGWVAMLEHYFVSAWVPPQAESNALYSRLLSNNQAIIGFTSQPVAVEPGATATIKQVLYIGPKDQATLKDIAKGLDLTVDYGILFWISQPLFALLKLLHDLVNNWGGAIILITVIVKGAMYWLTKAQYTSMAKMRMLQPKMTALRDRYGDDRQKMAQATMELYKKEKVNPMGGCFPILLQMPVFFALYWVLQESVELRHADFVLWIHDLSAPDPFFVLPALTGLTMFLLQKLQPMAVQDPMQAKIMQWMPVAMSIFFFFFPAGLVLYWLVSNIITLIQAKIIYAALDKKGLGAKS